MNSQKKTIIKTKPKTKPSTSSTKQKSTMSEETLMKKVALLEKEQSQIKKKLSQVQVQISNIESILKQNLGTTKQKPISELTLVKEAQKIIANKLSNIANNLKNNIDKDKS